MKIMTPARLPRRSSDDARHDPVVRCTSQIYRSQRDRIAALARSRGVTEHSMMRALLLSALDVAEREAAEQTAACPDCYELSAYGFHKSGCPALEPDEEAATRSGEAFEPCYEGEES